MEMNFAIKPPSLRQKNTQLTKEEVVSVGCCFSLSSKIQSNNSDNIKQFQRHSQPKPKREKKINLSIAKNRLFQAKLPQRSQFQYASKSQKYQNQLKDIQNTTNMTSLASKATTTKNSLKNSRTKLSLQNYAKGGQAIYTNQKSTSVNNKYNELILKATPQHAKVQISNIHNLSQISMIYQEFLSQGSTTLNALNFLNLPFSEAKRHELAATPVKYMIDAANQKRKVKAQQAINPLKKLIQSKKGRENRSQHRQKLGL